MTRNLLFIASAALVLLTGCKGEAPAAAEPTAVSQPTRTASDRIAYVNLDSLLMHYDMAIDLRAAFEAKARKVNDELNAKGRRFEKDYMAAQEKVQKGLVTRSQAAELEENLGRQQQALVEHRDKALQELAEEEQVMNNRIYYGVTDFLAEFNAGYKYAMILSTSASGPVLSADPALDITAEVLEGLNARYAAEKDDK